jgi:2-polyprenyl-6-methoxyphenol hydroxylase-like FAD-dependent oxidoreductase
MAKAPKKQPRTDMVIGGAGFAGLALGIALRQGLGDTFTVTVVDPALAAANSKDPRASAIAAAADISHLRRRSGRGAAVRAYG